MNNTCNQKELMLINQDKYECSIQVPTIRNNPKSTTHPKFYSGHCPSKSQPLLYERPTQNKG